MNSADGIRRTDVQLGKKDPVFSRNSQKPNMFNMLAYSFVFASLRVYSHLLALRRSILAKKWSSQCHVAS